ncbi:SDR family oxidoreductase [Undibacterium sp. Jales W-56]|uniref:UDP-glucose 4-epimerase family protein n=1 Tax=Undibacterium sp. Jales W-56 TaxID=2897325 RepID=UPI0021D2B8EC|nr:SDR family oxidoreductase [Undibacterium sp. Jales W-56]MCU6434602.1 SDR family oxidoreductase [Undibacterium sp. Jales W-56]
MTLAILLTGATGFVGQALMGHLQRQGHDLLCLSRQASNLANTGQSPQIRHARIEDMNAETDWSAHLAGRTHVIHCAARVHVMHETTADPLALFRQVNVDATLKLARQAAAAGVRQFVFISSVKVNGESTIKGQPFTEDSAPHPEDAYGISKYEAEQVLLALGRASGMAITIIRPPLVYGPGVKANFLNMLRWVKKGLPLPLASVDNRRSFVYLGNLVSLILTCLDHPKAAQEIFLASDGQDLSTAQLLQYCAVALDVPSRLFPFPPGWLMHAARLAGKQSVAERLCGSLQVDIGKAQGLLGWTPPWSVQQGLQATADALNRTLLHNPKELV